jgi:peptide-methionine (S)-S-oxide reductase
MISKRTFLVAALALSGLAAWMMPSSAEEGRIIPAPTVDEAPATTATSEVALLAGGCFWGVQGVFQHVEGVTGAVSGYAGGEAGTAHYKTVGRGDTGHAESVQVTFDPRKIAMARSCRSISRSPMTRPSSTTRGRTWGRNIAPPSSR